MTHHSAVKPLEVVNLTKNFGKVLAVNQVSFSVNPGEIFALIGPNGAGKSTTLRIIATLLTPTSGSVNVCGMSVTEDPQAVRQSISYLPEEAGGYKNLSGKDYLHFMAGLYSNSYQEANTFFNSAKEICGLGDRLNDKTGTYSKGMMRKLLLARAVMAKPTLAILDEPTSGLDVINALEIRKAIKQLSKEGMTVLLSSHNMLEIEFLSDRVGIIDRGKIYGIGTPKELKQQYNADNLEEVFSKAVSNK
ncbi:MAG: putative ABC transporter ATP-binding protein YbhF [bacterium ADurb.Bin400]|nr:MAG: putative ABC transporter ATP-binding protein YbhF [bacterium ADurb.Bin400]